MDRVMDALGLVWSIIVTLIIVYLLIKVWNAFWHWFFPSE